MASGGTDLSNQAEDNAFSPRIVPKPPMKSSDNLLKVRLVIGCDITVSNHEVNQSCKYVGWRKDGESELCSPPAQFVLNKPLRIRLTTSGRGRS